MERYSVFLLTFHIQLQTVRKVIASHKVSIAQIREKLHNVQLVLLALAAILTSHLLWSCMTIGHGHPVHGRTEINNSRAIPHTVVACGLTFDIVKV